MRSRQVIDVLDYQGQITAARGGLVIRDQRVPLEDVAVLLVGNHASISGGALSMLAKYDVTLLNCDWRGVPNFVGNPWGSNSRIATRHRAQADLSLPRQKSSWQALVRAKILGQAFNLEQVGSSAATRLRLLASKVRSGDPDNLEGQAARLYWTEFFEDEQFRRVPGAEDHCNAMLNYGYAVLRGFVIRGICEAGLSPTLGLWHRNRSNPFCLADDLIEPFRPAVDATVHRLLPSDGLEDRSVKHELVNVTNLPMQGTGETVLTGIYTLAQDLALFVEGEKVRLSVPDWQTPFASEDG